MNPDRPLNTPPLDRRFYLLALGALGIVYGDIGTSPLYAIRECFSESHSIAMSRANVLGVLSLIAWSLVLIVSLKYLMLLLRADNQGEGGVFALMALAVSKIAQKDRRLYLQAIGILGAALLYGDGMITPAITVLSAVEGLKTVTPLFEPFVIPIAVAILIALFLFQRYGTEKVGQVFGPLMLIWFISLGVLGIPWIVKQPQVLLALNPYYAIIFFAHNGAIGFLVLGSVFLVVTGGEAIYADMGHFGKRPIRFSWFALVLPALLINYFGQGAFLLSAPESVDNPFYRLAPSWALYPLVALATAAAVIASQAVISGAFSITRQALQLGYSPAMEIRYSSPHQIGQIYVPVVNWMLMLSTIGLVLSFRSSGNLAAAYGIAVSTTMVITAILAYFCMRMYWGWKRLPAILVIAPFLLLDLAFFLSNSIKIGHGGWFAFLVGIIMFIVMTTWHRGQYLLNQQKKGSTLAIYEFLDSIRTHPKNRVPGTAVYLNSDRDNVPRSFLHNLKHNKALHRQVIFLNISTAVIPRVPKKERLEARVLAEGLIQLIAHYGFMETPSIPQLLKQVSLPGFTYNPMDTTFFTSRNTLIPVRKSGMAIWRKHFFVFMANNAQREVLHYGIPPNRVVEMGAQIEF